VNVGTTSRRGAGARIGVVLAAAAGLVLSLAAAIPARAADSPTGGGTSTGGAPSVPATPAPPLLRKAVGVTFSPRAGSTVGAAMPITATFSTPVSYKKRAEQHLKVYLNGNLVKGAWYWRSSTTAVFRPQYFWPGKRVIGIRASLAGVVLREDTKYRYVGGQTTSRVHAFRTGRYLVAKVNNSTHQMKVYVNGALVRTMGVSLGKEGFITRSGVKAVMEKYVEREMTSEALGITDPNDQYVVISPYAVRLTNSGEFAHGAPWANSRIGRYNGSHGCTNLFVNDAKWFYDTTIPGDPVVYGGTGRPMEAWNGTGGPWNIPWSEWLAGSRNGVQKA
jgi:lipoprotein-anchoring transpeptidase ErfK/SrfK